MAEPAKTGTGPPPLSEALGWAGFRVDDMNGARLGRVLGIYVDAGDETPAWVLVKMGRFGKVTAIPYADCADGPGRIWTAHGRKVVRAAPAVESSKPLTRELEVALCEHYFIGPDRGRHAEIEGRGEETVTAKPAAWAAEGEG
jgi:hypothetical protein